MKVRWLILALIVVFILLAPHDALSVVDNLKTFFSGVFGGLHLH